MADDRRDTVPRTSPVPAEPPPGVGITVVDLAVLVLGAALGALPLGVARPEGEGATRRLVVPIAPILSRGAVSPTLSATMASVSPVVPYVLLPTAGLLLAGGILWLIRRAQMVRTGPGELLWALLAVAAVPYWLVPLCAANHPLGCMAAVWVAAPTEGLPGPVLLYYVQLQLVYAAAVAGWASLIIVPVGTVVCLVERRDRTMGWIGLSLAWLWLACLIASHP